MRKHFVEFHSHEEFHVLWDVSLEMGDWKIQMDGLLLTERCAIIMDSKNISGKIHFDEQTGEFYRFDDDNVKNVMKDPRIQLNKNIRFLAAWFELKKIKLPVSGLIISPRRAVNSLSDQKANTSAKSTRCLNIYCKS
ncbi:nuclease-related domain-containing protein [Planomicrobium okeanokoites]|uniref:nuclease-related domain-containing protein n=1 Tax=Planomicrobium okeanokoites TaxID=244 RepID=UPI000A054C59|nr:nuclease-related domain-containing protein [Planomicrobium okeanokoites]